MNINKNKYSIKTCKNDKDWDNFIKKTFKPNVFILSDYLNVEENIKKLFIYKKEELIAAFPINISKNNKEIIENKFALYTPIKIIERSNSTISKINNENYEINNFLCDYITTNFKKILLKFDYTVEDLRPFLWFGYPDYKKKFDIELRYTSELNLDKINVDIFKSLFFKNCSNTIRQQIRYSYEKNFKFVELYSSKIFFDLITQTFDIQNSYFDSSFYKKICEILDKLNKKNLIKMYCIKDHSDQIICCNIYSFIKNHSALIYSARSKIVDNKNYSGIFLLIKSFLELKNNKIQTIDLEGINSPKRSFYKLGLGGNLQKYFNIKML